MDDFTVAEHRFIAEGRRLYPQFDWVTIVRSIRDADAGRLLSHEELIAELTKEQSDGADNE